MKSREVKELKDARKEELSNYANKVAVTVLGVLIYSLFAPSIGFFGTLLCVKIAVALGYI